MRRPLVAVETFQQAAAGSATRGRARLLALLGLLVGLLGGLEVLCRVKGDALAAVAHRVRFKLALLRAKGPVDFVALGTSRTNDGLSPERLQLGTGFSAATPSSSLPTLEFQAAQLGAQQLVLLELSAPQLVLTPMDPEPAPPAGGADGDPVGVFLQRHSALLSVRRAFAVENLPRVFGLLAAPLLDGSEWFRSRQLVEMLRPPTPPEGVNDQAAWRPARVEPLEAPFPPGSEGARFVSVVRQLATRVVLVAPPVGAKKRAVECEGEVPRWRAAVAAQSGAPLLDFTCAEVDERWFVDGEHLSSPGRAQYSRVLGEALRALH